MLNTKLPGRSSVTVIGLLIFFVPFFTYLSPENLRQLSKSNVLEILLSLIIILVVIFISSFSVEMLMKRFFKKKIMLFPLLCFAFYLNFLYIPFYESVQEFIYPTIDHFFEIRSSYPFFIFFELCCLAIIVFGAKFNVFSIRMILIFSIFMLINAFIPLVGYLAETGKNPTISYEIESSSLTQDQILTERNVYYIILDGMMAIETAAQENIAAKKEVLGNLSNVGLTYIDKSKSSYSGTYTTLASIMLVDYHQKPSSPKYVDRTNFFPFMMYNISTELPLISYLTKANSSFIWTGNWWGPCHTSNKVSCTNLFTKFPSKYLVKFYSTTPLHHFILKFLDSYKSHTIGKFIEYIDKNGVPTTPFFAFIHHLSPHPPYLVTNECEPTKYGNQHFEGYKASYQCALKKVKMFMEKINNIDPEAIVVFQADHGWNELDLDLTEKEKYLFRGKIFNAIKAPEFCFDKYGLPQTNVNTIRFVLNCAYGFKLPYRENIHYENFSAVNLNPYYGTVIERKLYE